MKALLNKYKCLLVLSMLSQLSFAGNFTVLINADGGIPAVDTIVQQAHQTPAPDNFLLSTFNDYPPDLVRYLIIDRPTGNLLDLVNQHPQWTQAILYRYISVTYPYGVDATPILESLLANPLVDNAYYDSSVLNPLSLQPPIPVENIGFNLSVAYGSDCDSFVHASNSQGLSHNINYQNNVIELEMVMAFYPPAFPTICTDYNNIINEFAINPLPVGNYTLKLFTVPSDFDFPISESQRTYIGERDFFVQRSLGSIEKIPSLHWLSVAVLMVLTLLVLFFKFKHRR